MLALDTTFPVVWTRTRPRFNVNLVRLPTRRVDLINGTNITESDVHLFGECFPRPGVIERVATVTEECLSIDDCAGFVELPLTGPFLATLPAAPKSRPVAIEVREFDFVIGWLASRHPFGDADEVVTVGWTAGCCASLVVV
ncbi:hypothetical protein [Haloferax sp. AS1]|uniref:hypothetical protein n=1 Tax=Haloferax sp. AS1 TaxID=2562277 RepID=UPI0031F3063A